MRAVRLVNVAVEAETLRWKSMATRMATRAVFAVIALLFIVGVLVFAHIAAWFALRIEASQSVYTTTGILAAVDLVIAGFLGFLASRSAPSRAETEALQVRRQAVQSMGTALSMTQMAVPLLRLTNNVLRKSRA